MENLCQRATGAPDQEQHLAQHTNELWRYVLFSEFVYDLPVPYPVSLPPYPGVASLSVS